MRPRFGGTDARAADSICRLAEYDGEMRRIGSVGVLTLVGSLAQGCAMAHERCEHTECADVRATDASTTDLGVADARVTDSGRSNDAGADVVGVAVFDAAPRDASMSDTAVDDAAVLPPTPRPIAPLSTATVTTRRPTLRWALPPGFDGAHVELCADRGCTNSLVVADVVGTRFAPSTDLPARSVVFWRLRARSGSTTSDATSPTWQFLVPAASAPVDASWGSTLDVNGDGYADLLASGDATYLYLGRASGLDRTPALTIPVRAGVAGAGDVNGDGFADAVRWEHQSVSLYLGGASGLSSAPSVTLTLPGDAAFGFHAAGAGDVDGDGYGDVVVGSYSSLMPSARYVNLYRGGASGLARAPATTIRGVDGGGLGFWVAGAGDVNADGYCDVITSADMAHTSLVLLGSASGLATVGSALVGGLPVACAGDTNGDGYADVATGDDIDGPVHVYLGSASGVVTASPIVIPNPDGRFGSFGWDLEGVGDVDGDGYGDLAVGATGDGTQLGRVHLFRGGPAGPALIAATTIDEAPSTRTGDFGFALASGDIDGDGYPEVIAGARWEGDGNVYVFSGGASGLSVTPTIVLANPGGPRADFGWALARVWRRCFPSRG
jgi:hypothetical protein